LFQAMIDIGALNAYIIWKIHKGSERKCGEDRRHFLRSVSESLMEPLIAERSKLESAQRLPTFTTTAMGLMGYPPVQPPRVINPDTIQLDARGVCGFCRKTSRQRCQICLVFTCADHGTRVKTNHCHTCKVREPITEKPVQKAPAENKKPKQKKVRQRFIFGFQSIPDTSC